MPIVVSSKKYLIHFDNAPIGYLDLDSKKDNSLTYETVSGRKVYQVISGNSWEDLVKNYTDLPEMLIKQIEHFFQHYKDLEKGKWVKVKGWGSIADAHKEITDGMARYQKEKA